MNEFGALLNLDIKWFQVAIGFIAGFFIARKIPGFLPNVFKAQVNNNAIFDGVQAVASKLDEAATKLAEKIESLPPAKP